MPSKRSTIRLILVVLGLGLSACGPDSEIRTVSHRNEYLHVAYDGYNGDDGTADSPLSYPANAVEKAFVEGYRGVKIAAGDFGLAFNGVALKFYGGIDIIGGCDRSTWEPVPGRYSRVSTLGRPIQALGIRTPTLIQGLEIVGSPTSTNRPTSSTVYLDGCGPGLRFEFCRFVSTPGHGFSDRPEDRQPPHPVFPPQAGGQGTCDTAVHVPGGDSGWSGCPGGRGGEGGLPGAAGDDGRSGCDYYADGGAGGPPGEPGLDGQDGKDGTDGEHGKAVAGLGRIENGNLTPARGEGSSRASDGSGGGGGGGGGGSDTGSGNGGGAGGTGGQGCYGADGGNGGGHSIGVICINSAVVFSNCAFIAADGGRGEDGQGGGPGAAGCDGAPGGEACPGLLGRGGHGGRGGDGGASGGGGGGNGGSSIGLLEAGAIHPMVDATCTFAVGQPGEPGQGGSGGNHESRAESGYAGEAIERLVLPAWEKIKKGVHHLEIQH